MHGEIKSLFTASEFDLKHAGFNNKQITHIKNPPRQIADQDLQWCEKNNCHLLTLLDPNYPILLKEIHDAPCLLFIQGDITLLNQPQLAIVGSRNPTQTGKDIAQQFAQQLSLGGLCITSGFAMGIDAASHKGALSGGGKTIAVFGTGLKLRYPASHHTLADNILANQGVLISEFPPDDLPQAHHFPRRNRIISGLSLGVLIVEAALRSGSLISARYALEQGREVFAIPGSIHNPLARGCHQLIRQGAKLVETAKDIFEELNLFKNEINIIKEEVAPKKRQPLNKKTRAFLAQIGYEVTSFDTIAIRSGLTAGEVSSMLLALELQGYVQLVHGGYQLITTR
ncbi:MAG: DNA-protecting protein DprA [Gammaproteobacteria bacterium]|nr:DNA-protecting protein DprA [Gammaproteobacteria bacterium]